MAVCRTGLPNPQTALSPRASCGEELSSASLLHSRDALGCIVFSLADSRLHHSATFRGWQFCRDKPEACIQLFQDRGFGQEFMMNEVCIAMIFQCSTALFRQFR